MRRAWKIVLATVGIPTLCLGVLWIDSYYRAVAAIRAEAERLAKDIAEFRARQKPGLPIDPTIEMNTLPCPLKVFRNPQRPRLEDGHSGHSDFYNGVFGALFWISPDPAAVPRADQILASLSIAHQLMRECGYDSTTMLHGYELAALREVQRTVPRMAAPAEIRRFAQDLDRCLKSRPSFADSMEAEHLMNRAEVLRVLHRKQNDAGFIVRPPGWREFFSWRIHLVKALKELDREIQLLRPLESKSQSELQGVLELLSSEHATRRTYTAVAAELESRRISDREALHYWTAARTAVAILLYRAEQGRDPERLEDLPGTPLKEPGGDRLSFKDGILTLRSSEHETVEWVLRPK